MGRIYFLNRFYWPDQPATAQLLEELASALAGQGFHVTVITAHSAIVSTLAVEACAHVSVERVHTTHWGRHSLLGRAFDFASFHLMAGWRLFCRVRRGDTVVAMTDPPFLGLTVWLVTRLRGVRLLHWVQDIYPEIAAAVASQPTPWPLRALRDLAWHRSQGCIAPGRQMADVIVSAGVPPTQVTVAPNWAPGNVYSVSADMRRAVRIELGLDERFIVAYSGNLGRVHDLDPIIEIAVQLRSDPTIAFAIIGSGAQRDRLQEAAETHGLTNVRFFPAQPLSRLAATLSAADVHLVTLRPGCERYVFPSKLYGAAAAARPIIVIADPASELSRTVEASGIGHSFAREQTEDVARTILLLAREPQTCQKLGRAAAEFAAGGLARAVETWSRLLANASSDASVAPVLPLR